ncbi:hypothetical protein BDQ17DRAFT_1338614 [Cyathus striatus]|nr:hypothetical protein BDQ17DRAFT_1338614 [Cyathus striatus]
MASTIIQGLWHFKKINISGTGNKANTCMISLHNQFNAKTESAAERYRIAYSALQSLDPDGEWSTNLQPLRKEDISGPGHDNDNAALTSKGLSGLKLKQDKKWNEELQILMEEMRRVVKFCEWKSEWWMMKANERSVKNDTVQQGLVAYAYKQSELANDLATSCAHTWLPLLKKNGTIPTWAKEYQGGENDMEIEEDEEEDEDEDDIISGFHNLDMEYSDDDKK